MSNAVSTIRLYGRLGVQFGRVHHFAVKSPAEAMRALCMMIPGFEKHLMNSKDRGIGYTVFAGKQNLGENELAYPHGKDDIRIAPVILGAKKQGWGQVILGIVLVVVGVIYGYYTGDWQGASQIIIAGAGMILGGVMQLLSPQPKNPKSADKADNTPSYAFNGPVNTQAQGNPVPLLYGRLTVGSAVISAGISAQDQVYAPTDNAASGSAGGGGAGSGGGGGSAGRTQNL